MAYAVISEFGSEDPIEPDTTIDESLPVPDTDQSEGLRHIREVNKVPSGMLYNQDIRYVGQLLDIHMFDVGESTLTKTELESLGYTIQIVSNCLAVINRNVVTCQSNKVNEDKGFGAGRQAQAQRAAGPIKL